MSRVARIVVAVAIVLGASAVEARAESAATHPLASPFALRVASPEITAPAAFGPPAASIPDGGALSGAVPDPATELLAKREPKPRAPKPERLPVVLSAERAQTLLRSLTVPGWGQAALGHRTAATVFAIAEVGVWSSFTAFRIQEQLRRQSYQRTARILAGIDLSGRDEEFRRIVGSFISSDEYNQLVVYRDAANIYYKDGVLVDPAGYQQYVDEHSLKGSDIWAWSDDESLLRYRGQRKDAQRAALRANAALAFAVIDRLLSAVHAARLGPAGPTHSWKLETLPDTSDPTAFRVGVRTRF